MNNLVPTSSAIFKRLRPDIVPIMNRPGRGHKKAAGHSLADLVPILKTTSPQPDTPSRDEVTPHLTSTNPAAATSSHLVPDEVRTTSNDLVPRPPPYRGTRTSVANNHRHRRPTGRAHIRLQPAPRDHNPTNQPPTEEPMTDQTTALTSLQLDEIEGRAAALYESATVTDDEGQAEADQLTGTDVPALLAYVRRLQAQRKYLLTQLAKRDAESGAGDRALKEFLAADPDGGEMAERLTGTSPCGHGDYHDPHEWADRPGIWCPGHSTAEEQPAEACGKCKTPFDPADTRFDGHARHRETPYCRSCVDRCHESTDAFHRCVICDTYETGA